MKQSSTMISQLRKSFTNENDYSPSKPAVFVPHKLSKGSPLDAGLEYSHDVRNDAQYISKIFETSSYDHNHESLVEFYSDICYIMDSKELTDQRNAGAVMGMAALGAFGLVTFSVSFAGGVAGVIFGGTLGRIIANKISDRRAKKSSKVTQEDLFKLKLQCMLQLAKTSKKSKNNLNGHRLQIEKIIEESALALESSLFKNPKAISDVLIQIRRMLLDVNVQKAMLLSYKLFKVYMKIKDIPENERLQNVAKKLNTIFIPYTKFIELDQKHQTSGDASLTTYYKIKVLLAKPEIIEIIAQFPEYQLTPELLEKFQAFLAQEVDTVGPIKQAISKTSQSATMTEHNQLKGSKRKSVDPNKDMSPNLDNSSSSSLRDVKLEDIGEGGGICKTEIYNMELSKVKFQGGDSLSQNPIHNKIGAKAGDMSLNEPSSMDDNWSRKEEKEGSIRKNHAGDEELERSNNEPEGRIFKRMGSKSREYSQNYIDKDRSQLSQLAGLMKDERLDSPITPMTPVKDQPQSGNENILMKRASSKKDVKGQDKEKEEDINAKALAVNNNGVSQPSASNKAIFDKVLGIAYDEVTKWEKVINTPTIRIEKVRPEGSPVVLIRAWAVIEGYSPKEVFDQIYDAENRSKWDTVTVNLSVVEQIDPNTAIIHFIIKAPYPVSDRDFVQKRNFQLDYPEKGTITMSFQSFAHPKMPPVKNRIRGETHIAGYVLKASTKFPNSTDLCILTQVDIKGSIPKMIVNMVAGKAPAEWVSKLTKACERARQDKNKRGGK